MKEIEYKKYTVLIVDDNTENIKVLGTILVEEDFQLKVAQSGEKALDIVNKGDVDLILLDINMPDMDGFETCRLLKKDPLSNDIPIIFLTAYSDNEYKIKAFSAGGVDYITKPFQKEEVIARVKAHIEIGVYRKYLERKVNERTHELEISNKQLKVEIIKNKQNEDALIRSQKMEIIGTLAGGLTHDFNNVLGGIMGPVSILKNKISKSDTIDKNEVEKYLDIIEKSGDRASNMVKQLHSLSRHEKILLAPVDLNLTISHVIKICENSFDKSVILDPNYFNTPVMVSADPTQLEQVLLNLCINASHAMTIMRDKEEIWGGILTVSVERIKTDKYFCEAHPEGQEGDYCLLSVKDTGIGMRKEVVKKIFDPFFTTKEKGTGTGLGLAMVYNIIKKHNGFIDVYSEKGDGSIFSIFLPELKKSLDTDIEGDEVFEDYSGDGLILVIDDEEIMRVTAEEILREYGYSIIYAENGKEGLEIYKEKSNEIEAVLLDMSMPVMSGEETYIKMKEINPDVKVLLSSGFRQDKRVERLLELGISDFVQKPYTMKNLGKRIYNVIHN